MASDILRRVLGESDASYTTQLSAAGKQVDVTCAGLTVALANVSVAWSVDFDMRSWGIKSFDVTVQGITADLGLYDENDEVRKERIEVHQGDTDYKVDVRFNTLETDAPSTSVASLYPRHVDINVDSHVIVVSF